MDTFFRNLTVGLGRPLSGRSRAAILVAALALIPTLLLPLWHMNFVAQQYPEGLDLYIYSHSLEGGDRGNDLTEINVLNHYIGMAELHPEDFTEFEWIPLIIGLVGIIALRAAAIGTLGSALDVLVVSGYFGAFSLWSFYRKLSSYGHDLDLKAAVKVDPFTPPVFGHKLVGQFEVSSYPAAGSLFFAIFGLLIVAALGLTYWGARQANHPHNSAGDVT